MFCRLVSKDFKKKNLEYSIISNISKPQSTAHINIRRYGNKITINLYLLDTTLSSWIHETCNETL